MKKNYFQKTEVKSNSEDAFDAINLHVSKWWGSVDNIINEVGDQFTITFGEAYWTFEIKEFVNNEKVVWLCIDGQPELNHEWIGHVLTWSINKMDKSTVEISFYQEGLTDALPCFNVCSSAWDRFILSSLKQYLETGIGTPGS